MNLPEVFRIFFAHIQLHQRKQVANVVLVSGEGRSRFSFGVKVTRSSSLNNGLRRY